MDSPWIAALAAVFLWWFATGAILIAVRRSGGNGAPAAVASLPVLALGVWGYMATLDDGSVSGAYLGFLSALAIWGWIELAFLVGLITGPNLHPCPRDVPEWERFIRAWGTIAYHEMLILGAALSMLLFGWGGENPVGLWTFLILFAARVSAKLNLYFGVPSINVEFLPEALAHVPSHFRVAAMNWLFPVSVTLLGFAVDCWLERMLAADTSGAAVGFALLAAITALALVEHWMMVLPLPDAKLWRWMLPTARHSQLSKTTGEVHHGF
ncbi:putative photosynthetic complex assembly protein PuhE [Sulfitobacter sp. LCG007]